MQLPQPFQHYIDQLFGGKSPADITRIGITAIALIVTLLAAAAGGSSTPEDDGSSDDGGETTAPEQPDNPDYVDPPLDVQLKLDTIRTEVYGAVNDMRTNQNLGMVPEYPERADEAQAKAELNATTGKEENVDENIGMLQHHLPLDDASGFAFIEAFRNSPEHLDVLMSPTNLYMAVGTAYSASDDTVWLVIQME